MQNLYLNKDTRRFLNQIDRARIIVCCGSGGVGKTTISASLGLYGALSGRKTLVLTIDPAKRLADSLGLGSFDYDEQRIPDQTFKNLNLKPSGELHAMMLDTKRTFDNLINRHASSEKMRQNIFNNRYYQHLSGTLAGSHEYMAMEKLYELYQQNRFDLIVLDTPPSRRALDFLEAPDRLSNLLGHHAAWKLLKPYFDASMWGAKLFTAFSSPALKMMSNMMGSQMLHDLVDFFRLGDDMFFGGFRERAQAVKKLLGGSQSLFIAITSPMRAPLKETLFLYEKLKEYEMPFGGFIINRVHPVYPGDIENSLVKEDQSIDPKLMAKLISNFNKLQKLGKSDADSIKDFREIIGPEVTMKQIPYLESDVHDFSGLIKINDYLRT